MSAPDEPFALDRILIAIDFSQDSRRALACIAALAKPTAELTLFHVCAPFSSMEAIVPGVDTSLDERSDRSAAVVILEALREELERSGFDRVRVQVETGDPASLLLARAKDGAFDLVVMGTHGRRGIRRALMGSVAETVTRRAPCPVLTMHLPSVASPES